MKDTTGTFGNNVALRLPTSTPSQPAGADLAENFEKIATHLANQAVFNIKDFGALVDGSTDDTVAVQACFDAAIASKLISRKVVYPGGTCVHGPISITGLGQDDIGYILPDVPLEGRLMVTSTGPGAVVKMKAGDPADLRAFYTITDSGVGRFSIQNLRFEGNSSFPRDEVDTIYKEVVLHTYDNDTLTGILIADCFFVSMWRVWMARDVREGAYGEGSQAYYRDFVGSFTVRDSTAYNTREHDFLFSWTLQGEIQNYWSAGLSYADGSQTDGEFTDDPYGDGPQAYCVVVLEPGSMISISRLSASGRGFVHAKGCVLDIKNSDMEFGGPIMIYCGGSSNIADCQLSADPTSYFDATPGYSNCVAIYATYDLAGVSGQQITLRGTRFASGGIAAQWRNSTPLHSAAPTQAAPFVELDRTGAPFDGTTTPHVWWSDPDSLKSPTVCPPLGIFAFQTLSGGSYFHNAGSRITFDMAAVGGNALGKFDFQNGSNFLIGDASVNGVLSTIMLGTCRTDDPNNCVIYAGTPNGYMGVGTTNAKPMIIFANGATNGKIQANPSGSVSIRTPSSAEYASYAAALAQVDADMTYVPNGMVTLVIDETAGKIKFRIRKHDGTFVTSELAYA